MRCRYDVNGFVKELPQLPEERSSHACAALPITKVRPKQNQPFVQAFIVAGGYTSEFTSSVVTLLHGATAWTPLASLPRSLYLAQASIVGGRMRINGGYDGGFFRTEVMIEKWWWMEVVHIANMMILFTFNVFANALTVALHNMIHNQ